MRNEVLKARVAAWNQAIPIGHPVLVVNDTGQIVDTRTRGDAYVLGGHSALVMVEGITGGYALERVIPVVNYKEA